MLLNKTTAKTTNKELKEILNAYLTEHDAIANASRVEYMKTLGPGANVPQDGVIYGDLAKTEFAQICAALRSRLNQAVSVPMEELNKKLSAAPSADAVNAISLLKLRTESSSHVTETEIQALVEAYGGNVQAYRAIRDLAKTQEVYLPGDGIEETVQRIQGVQNSMQGMMRPDYLENGVSPKFVSFWMETCIDNCFPAED